ncbi:RNA polymerase sigma factor (sigma-70 family) [Streptomonospora salina]|uniref:RNA polymerase sigma factor (Sigma-70 family) n=1 Tax=Streptomonospora salina TaxID=104205 RepID=A0A841EIX1_9ACTN|nr:sigma-70 family RNA polymerase sigma factor [Streptomonospora salina]MBB6001339.1 RNA polymerase sigma factor (sigma-70 family) [Streptomonospora salina]
MAEHDSTQYAPARSRTEYTTEQLFSSGTQAAAYMSMRGASTADAEDAVAYAYGEARRYVAAGNSVRSLTGLMCRIAWCFYAKQVDRRKKDVLCEDVAETVGAPADYRDEPGHDLELQEGTRRVLKVVGGLPEHQREAMVLRVLCDMDDAAIARQLDIGPGAVRKRIERARSALKAMGKERITVALAVSDNDVGMYGCQSSARKKNIQEGGGP